MMKPIGKGQCYINVELTLNKHYASCNKLVSSFISDGNVWQLISIGGAVGCGSTGSGVSGADACLTITDLVADGNNLRLFVIACNRL